MLRWLSCASALVLSLTSFQAYGEIQSVTVRWKPDVCIISCQKLLYEQFKKINTLKDVRFDGPAGKAELIYKEGAPYDYTPINYAYRMVGVAQYRGLEMRIQLKGKITIDGSHFYITSTGDGTRGELFTPPPVSNINMVNNKSIYAYGMDENVAQKLREVKKNKQEVIVEGRIFAPWRPGPLYIILGSVKPVPKSTK